MTTFLVIALFVVGFIFLLPHLADEKTKLFRRVWSSERASAGRMIFDGTRANVNEAQDQAIKALMKRYGISESQDGETLRKSVAGLMADAFVFDAKHPNNMGVEVTSVLVREIRIRCPNISD